MRRLYYLADDLATTQAISETLHDEGITDWNFHVVARDEGGLYRHHIHSATPIQQLDIVHTSERYALIGVTVGLLSGLAAYLTAGLPVMVVFGVTFFAAFFGGWLGGMVGLSRESYKLEPFHREIEAGRYLIMVDVQADTKARVREIMNMGFPRVRYCGKDSTLINPLKSPRHVYPQTTH
ncbi:MAG: hypothetical protein PVF57_09400 [Pseudomonadales bacterium]|jgi:hypothetical protein